jgi:hypothetical protein
MRRSVIGRAAADRDLVQRSTPSFRLGINPQELALIGVRTAVLTCSAACPETERARGFRYEGDQ